MTETNNEAPHRAVIWVRAEIRELLKTGECSGVAVHKNQWAPILTLDGENKESAIMLLEQFLEKLKRVKVQ